MRQEEGNRKENGEENRRRKGMTKERKSGERMVWKGRGQERRTKRRNKISWRI
jgi:hypothetical protein